MRIPFYYLLEMLQSQPNVTILAAPSRETKLARPKFVTAQQSLEAGRLYVLSPAVPIPSDIPASAAVLSSTEPDVLFNFLQDLYDHCEEVRLSLATAVSTGEIRDLMDEIEGLFSNPALIYKNNYAIVACSGEVFSDPRLAPFRGSHLPYEFVNNMKQDPDYNTFQTTAEPFFFRSSDAMSFSLGINLLLNSDSPYRLTILPILRSFTEGDLFLLSLCAEFVVQALKNSVISGRFADPTGRKDRLIELFRSGVEHENADPTVLEQGFSAQGWMPSHEYCCVSVQLGTPDFLNQTLDLLCSQLEALLPSACIYPHMGTIAVLLNMTLAGGTIHGILDKCVYFFRDNDLRTGVSNLFHGFQSLRGYHKQSLIALNFASRPQSYLWVQHFSNVVLDYILEQSNRELPLQLICSPQILTIRQYDKSHQTDYYDTLECYIRNRFNAVQTAKELQIHRSTFLYRMERLQDLFHLDLSHSDALLYALLSMKMLETSKSMMQHV